MVDWIKVQNIEISERNSLPKIGNINKNQSTVSKINIVVKNIIYEQKPDLTFLSHLIYASAVISTELCGVKIKAPKRNVPEKHVWQERIQNQINILRSDLETLKNVNNVKICKSKKLRTKYKIKHPEEIQTVLEIIKQTIQAKAARLRRHQNLVSTKITTYLKTIRNNSIEILVNHNKSI